MDIIKPLINWVYQRLKKGKDTQSTVESVNDEGCVLKNIESEATSPVSLEDLAQKWRFIGVAEERDGVLKVREMEEPPIAEAPEPPLPVIAAGQSYHQKDDLTDVVTIQGPGEMPRAWNCTDRRSGERVVLLEDALRSGYWVLMTEPLTIEATRTADPADPPLTEAGVVPCSETGSVHEFLNELRADAFAIERIAKTPAELVMLALMRGELREVTAQFKAKEFRLFFPDAGGRGSIIATDDLQELASQIAQELLLHWSQVSANPKPDELQFKGRIHPMPKGAPADAVVS